MAQPDQPLKGPRFGGFMGRITLLGFLLMTGLAPGHAREFSSDLHPFRLVPLIQNLDHPWSMAWLPDGRMLITERPGRLRIVRNDFKLEDAPVLGLPEIVAQGQGGLLDVAVDQQDAKHPWIYLAYSAAGPGGSGTALMRARLQGGRLVEQQQLFSMAPKSGSGQHFGGRIVLDEKDFVYLMLGDRGDQDRAQRLDDHAGSVIRLHKDGRIPKDNPFVNRPGAKPETFTIGNRNIQGAALHPQTGELWTHEHGPQGGDEVNIIRSGLNYGWPIITYGVNYGLGTRIGEGTQKPGLEQPLYYWTPSIAPSGMAFYEGPAFPKWRGHLFLGGLRSAMLVRLELKGNTVTKEERLLEGVIGRIRDVRVGPDGLIYLLTDASRGGLYRLEPIH